MTSDNRTEILQRLVLSNASSIKLNSDNMYGVAMANFVSLHREEKTSSKGICHYMCFEANARALSLLFVVN